MGEREELLVVARDFAVPAVFGGGGLVAWFRAWWKARKKRRKIERLELEAVTKLLDVQRHHCWLATQPDRLVEADDHEARTWSDLHAISEIRDELWVARGNQLSGRDNK